MTSRKQNPENVFLVGKDSSTARIAHNIDLALDKFDQIEIRSAGTAVEKAILVAERCVQQGFAQYSRFTTQEVEFDNRPIIYTVIKMKRPKVTAKKPQQQKAPQKKYVAKNPTQQKKVQPTQAPRNNQKNERKYSYDERQNDRNRRQAYNDDHRQRNARREQQNYHEKNQRNNQRNQRRNENDRNRDRDYR